MARCMIPLALMIILVSACGSASADGHADAIRHHEAHEHGVAHMNVALEGETLYIEFYSPAANIGYIYQMFNLIPYLSVVENVTLPCRFSRCRRHKAAARTVTFEAEAIRLLNQLLLYTVFRIGNATNNISWKSYREIARNPHVKWTIPISLGDSHQGYRVMGTNSDYFEHFPYAGGRSLEMAVGRKFEGVFDAVLGAEVAQALNYSLEDPIVIAHGAGKVSFIKRDDKPFKVVGILKKNRYARRSNHPYTPGRHGGHSCGLERRCARPRAVDFG